MTSDEPSNRQVLDAVQLLSDAVQSLSSEVQRLYIEVQTLPENLTRLTRTVDRIDQRLVEVEKHTRLIPGITQLVISNSNDIDDHDKQLKWLTKRLARAQA